MDTLSFFRRLVPDTGYHFITEWVPKTDHPRGGVMPHHPVDSLEDMVDKAFELDAKGRNVYFSMASFKGVIYKERNGYQFPAGREQSNALHVKCLWQDFDVGKKDVAKSYESREEALASLKLYLRETGMPTPLIVSSGNGIHAYWPFTEHVTSEEWESVAKLQRVVFKQLGVKYDSARDKDCASVLRPIGCHNYGKGEPKLVRVVKEADEPRSAEWYKTVLLDYIEAHDLAVPMERAKRNSPFAITHDLEAYESTPSYIAVIAEHCAQVANFRDTGGESEPEWWADMGLAKHCDDGGQYAHEWGAKYDGYDPTETQSKLDNWEYGPTTCAKFQEIDATRCAACPHKGKITSPIQLGKSVVDQTTAAPEDAPEPTPEVDIAEGDMPPGYRIGEHQMQIAIEEDGVTKWVPFSNCVFYATKWCRDTDGTYVMHIKHQVRGGVYDTFKIPTKVVSEKRTLRAALAAYAVTVTNEIVAHRYMSEFLEFLKKRVSAQVTHKQMGWDESGTGFVIGEACICETSNKEIILSEEHIKAPEVRKAFLKTGDLLEWTNGVDALYNKPGLEPYQYVFATVFGSVISPLLGDRNWRGIPLALTSDKSGYGKSTVAKIAINALCDSTAIMISDATPKSIINRASQHKNLILYADEAIASTMSGTEMGNIFYSLSNGKARIGSDSSGKERESNPDFHLLSILTGNRCVVSSITESKINPEAQQMRVLEVDLVDIYGGKPPFAGETPEMALHLMNNFSSVAAEKYVRYVIKHRERIQTEVYAFALKLLNKLGDLAHKERFYAYHVACAIYGLKIACDLGILRFDSKNLLHWIMGQLKRIRNTIAEQHMTAGDKLSAMLADLHGSLVITKAYDSLDARRGLTEMPLLPVRGTAAGRLVLGTQTERGKLYVTIRAVDEWCKKEKLNPHQFKRDLLLGGLVRTMVSKNAAKKISLGKGVPTIPMGQTQCVEIDFDAAQGYIREFVPEDNVVEMKPKAVTNPVTEKETASEEAALTT